MRENASDNTTAIRFDVVQERPEDVPTGELPRALTATCDRKLVGTVSPGTRVTIVGVYSIHNAQQADKGKKDSVAIRQPFIRCRPCEGSHFCTGTVHFSGTCAVRQQAFQPLRSIFHACI